MAVSSSRTAPATVPVLPGLMAAMTTVPASSASAADHDDDAQRSCQQWVALTFDDGPSSYRTQTLRTLRERDVPVTFFDVGMRVAANPQLARFQAQEGHLVLNHTWSHPHLPQLTPAQVESEVLRTEQALSNAGAPMPFRLLRPPFGDVDVTVDAQLTAMGYHHVNWDVAATDWDVATTPEEISDTIVAALRPGLVILMHDGAMDSAAGAAVKVALPQVIDQVRGLGYCFGQLDALHQVVPARMHSSDAAIPRVINPVPYLPLSATSRGILPPQPYVVVDPLQQV